MPSTNFFQQLRILRRYRVPIVVVAALAAALGFFSAPATPSDGPSEFTASHVLIANPEARVSPSLKQAALFVTTGGVPPRVAERFAPDGPPAGTVTASSDIEVSTVTVTAKAPTPEAAETLADAHAEELVALLADDLYATHNGHRDEAARRADELRGRIEALGDAADADPVARAQLNAMAAEYADTVRTIEGLDAAWPPPGPLQTLEAATAKPVAPGAQMLPAGAPARAVLAGLVGLSLAVAGALSLGRIDTKVRDSQAAKAIFGSPTVTVIPPRPAVFDDDTLVALADPASPYMEAHRALRTALLLQLADAKVERRPGVPDNVVTVVSPGAGEGKTTTAAHLAAAFAEIDLSVLLVSADLRRPRLHDLVGAPAAPGLTDAVQRPGPDTPGSVPYATDVDGVFFLASGTPVDNPAPVITKAQLLITDLARRFDVVIVDTAPLLAANDAAELAQISAGVVAVARAGKTSHGEASRATELLRDAGAGVIGLAVIAPEHADGSGYYGGYYYGGGLRTDFKRGAPSVTVGSGGPVPLASGGGSLKI